MRVLFISNYLNLHQSRLWDCFIKNEGVTFSFLGLSATSSTLKKEEKRPYCQSLNTSSPEQIRAFLGTFDVIILGDCQNRMVLRCIPRDRVIVHYSEHYWKKISTPLAFAKRIFRMLELKHRYKGVANLYLLAASSRLRKEFLFFRIPFLSCFRFGYFPPVNRTFPFEAICERDSKQLIFAGRAIKWKRAHYSLLALKEFSKNDQNWHLKIFSEGKDLKRIQKLSRSCKKSVTFGSFLPHDQLIKAFASSSVFVFSSNREEGWGAVLNEALSAGCIVFACVSAGSTNYLIKDGYNGFVFKSRKELKAKIRVMLKMNQADIQRMRERAFSTISNRWNEEIAAKRLYYSLSDIFSGKQPRLFQDKGPLSLDTGD